MTDTVSFLFGYDNDHYFTLGYFSAVTTLRTHELETNILTETKSTRQLTLITIASAMYKTVSYDLIY